MCQRGETEEAIIEGKSISVDRCIREKVQEINDMGYVTISSCCGHGRYPPTIVIGQYCEDGRVMGDFEFFTSKNIWRDKRKIYSRDIDGFHFIPEVSPDAILPKKEPRHIIPTLPRGHSLALKLTETEQIFVDNWKSSLIRKTKGCDFREKKGDLIEVKSQMLRASQRKEMKRDFDKGKRPILAHVTRQNIMVFKLIDIITPLEVR